MDQYTVKFWILKDEGFREQLTETVKCGNNKNSHRKAEKIIKNKYKNKLIEITSVRYD